MRPLLVLLLVAAGCAAADPPDTPTVTDAPAATDAAVFDPASLAPGDTVAGLRVLRADFRRGPDSVWTGRAAFGGRIVLSGTYRPHPDAAAVPCLFVDAASAPRLPRLAGDDRRSWLCASDPAAAVDALGLPDGRAVRVEVERFDYVYERSDVANAARFVRALAE